MTLHWVGSTTLINDYPSPKLGCKNWWHEILESIVEITYFTKTINYILWWMYKTTDPVDSESQVLESPLQEIRDHPPHDVDWQET